MLKKIILFLFNSFEIDAIYLLNIYVKNLFSINKSSSIIFIYKFKSYLFSFFNS